MFLQGPQFVIASTLSGDGFRPSYVHRCPTTTISAAHKVDLVPEKVPPAYFMRCTIRFTFCMCSHTNLRIPEFSGITSYPPLSSSYRVFGPLIGTSSMYGSVNSGISSRRIYVTSS